MSGFRTLARRVAYRSGALDLARAMHRDALTVVMFHRVISNADPIFADADPLYTVDTGLFDELLEFFLDHYTVVSLADVRDSVDKRRPLPAYPLLITFDDGWADNLRYAAPLLGRRRLPAVIFAVADAVLSPENSWWQEEIFAAARAGRLTALEINVDNRQPEPSGDHCEDPLGLICRLGVLSVGERARILKAAGFPERSARMMLAPSDLAKLAATGIVVGNHGYTHVPLTAVRDPAAEIRRAAEMIAGLTGDEASASALSVPHGRYDSSVISEARAAGARLVFTSDPILNPAPAGFAAADRPIGRIPISRAALMDGSGHLDRSAAATWLWRRPIGQRDGRRTVVGPGSSANHKLANAL